MSGPVFVVGMPRSGTTLLSEILSAHPGLVIGPETHYYRKHVRGCDRKGCLEDPERTRAFVRSFLQAPGVREMGFSAERRRQLMETILDGQVTHRRILGTVLEAYAEDRGAPRWGERTPGHIDHVERIREDFPEARFVHVLRDPRDVSRSLMEAHGEVSNPHHHAVRWKRCVQRWDRHEERFPEACHLVRYEDLLEDPEGIVGPLCAALDLDPREGSVPSPGDGAGPDGRGGSSPVEEATAPDPSTAGLWRSEMHLGDVLVVEHACGHHMERWGYETVDVPPTVPVLVRAGRRHLGAGLGRVGRLWSRWRDRT